MSKSAMIRARTDSQLKEKVEHIFDELGLNATAAINIFYKQVLLSNGLPFEIRLPNAATRKAIREANGRMAKRFKNANDMLRALKS
jgi:DNA-damage-inducible protein J